MLLIIILQWYKLLSKCLVSDCPSLLIKKLLLNNIKDQCTPDKYEFSTQETHIYVSWVPYSMSLLSTMQSKLHQHHLFLQYHGCCSSSRLPHVYKGLYMEYCSVCRSIFCYISSHHSNISGALSLLNVLHALLKEQGRVCRI